MLTVKASREQVSTHCISSYHEDSFDQNTLASVTAQVIPRKSVTLRLLPLVPCCESQVRRWYLCCCGSFCSLEDIAVTVPPLDSRPLAYSAVFCAMTLGSVPAGKWMSSLCVLSPLLGVDALLVDQVSPIPGVLAGLDAVPADCEVLPLRVTPPELMMTDGKLLA